MNAYRKLLAFGTGLGVEIAERDLEVVVARVRPTGTEIVGRTTIRNFRGRPASEWGAEYSAFLKSLGEGRLSATVLVPRGEVIVRCLALPGVAPKDMEAAVALQIDTLHPYGEDDIAWGWMPLKGGSAVVVIERRAAMEKYAELFSEAGVPVTSLTVSAAAVYQALRVIGPAPAGGCLAIAPGRMGELEAYGESPSRPLFSAAFELDPARAAALAASELRLPPETPAVSLVELLPPSRRKPVEPGDAPAYAAAVAGACPWLGAPANLLPLDRRVSTSRAMFVPTAALAALLLLATGGLLGYNRLADSQYTRKLETEVSKLEPKARESAAMDRAMDTARARARVLDEFRSRTRADLDALNELTRLLPPPVWTNSIEVSRDSVSLSGEADAAAPLLKVLDASPLFQNSEPQVITSSPNKTEIFRFRTMREVRK